MELFMCTVLAVTMLINVHSNERTFRKMQLEIDNLQKCLQIISNRRDLSVN